MLLLKINSRDYPKLLALTQYNSKHAIFPI